MLESQPRALKTRMIV